MSLKNPSRLYQQSTLLHILQSGILPSPSPCVLAAAFTWKQILSFMGHYWGQSFSNFRCFKNSWKRKNYVPSVSFVIRQTPPGLIFPLCKAKKNPSPNITTTTNTNLLSWVFPSLSQTVQSGLHLGLIKAYECLIENICLGTDPWNKSNSFSCWFRQHFSSKTHRSLSAEASHPSLSFSNPFITLLFTKL